MFTSNKKRPIVIAGLLSWAYIEQSLAESYIYPQNIEGYQRGDLVTHNGETYQCIQTGWCVRRIMNPGEKATNIG